MERGAITRSQTSGFQQLRDIFSQPNPRKRAFPDESTTSLTTAASEHEHPQHDFHQSEQNGIYLRHKRSRINEWPLKNSIDPDNFNRLSPRNSSGRNVSARGQARPRKVTNRPSKFQEGSLNDKPSKQPPAAFTGAEDAMDQYHQYLRKDEKNHIADNADIEGSRPSSTYVFGRFGKAMANVFNGFWKEKGPSEPPSKYVAIDDQKAKAEEAYALLKAQGFKGTKNLPKTNDHQNLPGHIDCTRSCRDLGVDAGESQPSLPAGKRTNRAIEGLQPPPNTPSNQGVSPASVISSNQRHSSFHLRAPSFQSLKNVKSQKPGQLITRSAEEQQDHKQDAESIEPTTHDLSRQELTKYWKLSKKVSNLEAKLENARRELEESLKGAPPIPDMPIHHAHKPFTPGTLASLPSERLLTPQTTVALDVKAKEETCESNLAQSAPELLSSPSRQLDSELRISCSNAATNDRGLANLLMSREPTANSDAADVNHACWVAAQAAKNRRKSSQCMSEKRPSIGDKMSAGNSKTQRKVISKTPKSVPLEPDKTHPPMPVKPLPPNEADQPRPDSPFLGRPTAATTSPTKNHYKAYHYIKTEPSPAPKSNPAASNSPCKLNKINNKNNTTPFKIHEDDNNEDGDSALTPDSSAGNRKMRRRFTTKGSPAPKAVQIRAARAKAVRVSSSSLEDKKGRVVVEEPEPVPRGQIENRLEEEFEWDDDVF